MLLCQFSNGTMTGDPFQCKNRSILYFKPTLYMTLTSWWVSLLGHWAPRNFMEEELKCFSPSNSFWNANKSLHLTLGEHTALGQRVRPLEGIIPIPLLWARQTQSQERSPGILKEIQDAPKSVTWVTSILTAEIDPKLRSHKIDFSSCVLWTVSSGQWQTGSVGAFKVPG